MSEERAEFSWTASPGPLPYLCRGRQRPVIMLTAPIPATRLVLDKPS